jgi:small subunit ribosomal protein S17
MATEQDLKAGIRKEFVGIVVSDKMKKTIVVEITRLTKHSQYAKTTKEKKKFKAHDEKNEAHIGDKVRIVETRPISKDKHCRLVEIISKSKSTERPVDL